MVSNLSNCHFHQRYLAEFFGTLFLILMGVGAALLTGPQIGLLGISFNAGMVLMALIYTFGPVSGCHLNPAVTLALYFAKRLAGRHVVPYMIAQFLGAIAGAYIVYLIASGKAGFEIGNFACNGYGEHSPQHYSMLAAGIIEVVIALFLIFVVLVVTRADFTAGSAPLALGFTLMAIHLFSLSVTGTSANIARSFATAIIAQGWALKQLWLFAIAHIIGVGLAFSLYRLLYSRETLLHKWEVS